MYSNIGPAHPGGGGGYADVFWTVTEDGGGDVDKDLEYNIPSRGGGRWFHLGEHRVNCEQTTWLQGHSKGEGAPSRVKHGSILFQTLSKSIRQHWEYIVLFRTVKTVQGLATFAIPQACIINTKLEIWGGGGGGAGGTDNGHKGLGGGALAPSAPVLLPPLPRVPRGKVDQ